MKLGIMATGGMDSTLLMHLAACELRIEEVVLYYTYYGQAVAPREMENVNYHAKRLWDNPTVRIIEVSYHNIASNMLLQKDPKPVMIHDQDDPRYYKRQEMLYPDTHIEGRNAIMVAYTAVHCMRDEVDELWAGYKFTDEDWANCRSYKLATADNGPEFVDAMNFMLKYGYSRPLRFRAPLMEGRFNKTQVKDALIGYGVNIEDYTYSCYYPEPCGKCDNCLLRSKM